MNYSTLTFYLIVERIPMSVLYTNWRYYPIMAFNVYNRRIFGRRSGWIWHIWSVCFYDQRKLQTLWSYSPIITPSSIVSWADSTLAILTNTQNLRSRALKCFYWISIHERISLSSRATFISQLLGGLYHHIIATFHELPKFVHDSSLS